MSAKRFWIVALTLGLVLASSFAGSNLLKSTEAPIESSISPRAQAAERLVIQYTDGQFELISRTAVQKVLPPSVELPSAPAVRGSWFEVQDGASNVVYRRLMNSPQILYSETLSDETGEIVRSETTVTEQTFSVLVPANASAQSLAVFDQPANTTQRTTTAAAEIGRLTLR